MMSIAELDSAKTTESRWTLGCFYQLGGFPDGTSGAPELWCNVSRVTETDEEAESPGSRDMGVADPIHHCIT